MSVSASKNDIESRSQDGRWEYEDQRVKIYASVFLHDQIAVWLSDSHFKKQDVERFNQLFLERISKYNNLIGRNPPVLEKKDRKRFYIDISPFTFLESKSSFVSNGSPAINMKTKRGLRKGNKKELQEDFARNMLEVINIVDDLFKIDIARKDSLQSFRKYMSERAPFNILHFMELAQQRLEEADLKALEMLNENIVRSRSDDVVLESARKLIEIERQDLAVNILQDIPESSEGNYVEAQKMLFEITQAARTCNGGSSAEEQKLLNLLELKSLQVACNVLSATPDEQVQAKIHYQARLKEFCGYKFNESFPVDDFSSNEKIVLQLCALIKTLKTS